MPKSSCPPRQQKGAAAVEMALVLPLLMLILLGMVDAATALYDYSVINHGARVGARWGTIPTNNPTGTAWSCTNVTTTGTTSPCEVANAAISGLLLSYKATTAPKTSASGGGTSGSTLTVTTSYTFKGTFTGAFLSLPLSATSKMNNE